jgi:hypothetical protein
VIIDYDIPALFHGNTPARLELTLDMTASTFRAVVWDDSPRDEQGNVKPFPLYEVSGPLEITPEGVRASGFGSTLGRLTGTDLEIEVNKDAFSITPGVKHRPRRIR